MKKSPAGAVARIAGKFTEDIAILGSTGSIGRAALDIVREQPDRFSVAGLAARLPSPAFFKQAAEFHPKFIACGNADRRGPLQRRILSMVAARGQNVLDTVEELAAMPGTTKVVAAMSGAAGIGPALAAVNAGKKLLIANKEALVAAGEIIMAGAAEKKTGIVPIDSEHSAIFQCLAARQGGHVRKLILTASGGPFLRRKNLSGITPQQALKHPKWKMGNKVSVDSASLMNKGLEIIEAMWLFGVPEDRIEVLVHPEAIIHSMVEFTDGTVIALLCEPDMRIPMRYALNYPNRPDAPHVAGPDFLRLGKLTFEAPDTQRFPCLDLGREAARRKGLYPAILSAADETAVEAFLAGQLAFGKIPDIIEYALKKGARAENSAPALDEIIEADKAARKYAGQRIKSIEIR